MSLPAFQQQVLDGIERDLEGCEPGLMSMFAIFTRLTRDDGAPRTEALLPVSRLRRAWPRRPRRPRPARVLGMTLCIPLVLGLVALLVFLAITGGSAAHGCGPGAGPHAAAATRVAARVAACQPAPEAQNRS